eukprot:CAMPEP_0170619512 /NCGR_PEP_ID=MMETSP0224-20130122/27556_1 /TAXON_ID=285029 /ORGANISM="Togula jolla, Strain CCCM 725" /LENGTH=193 /DNA_ID=CAMNT_0010945607 /DNA_START=24 /DNA_END=605 /DNA_ORIENTATION=-
MPIERAPARDGCLPVLAEKEEVKHSEPKTKMYIGERLEGEGILHLTNQRIVWLAEGGVGCAMDYPFVTVHAVSRDASAWPQPCLYCQLRTEEVNDEDDGDDGPDVTELRFVPDDSSHLQRIFTVFSEMSALNPDLTDEQAQSEDSEDDDILEENQPQQLGVIWTADDNDAAMEDAETDEDEEDGAMETESGKV